MLSNHVCGKLDPPSFNGTWFHKIFGKLNPDTESEFVVLLWLDRDITIKVYGW